MYHILLILLYTAFSVTIPDCRPPIEDSLNVTNVPTATIPVPAPKITNTPVSTNVTSVPTDTIPQITNTNITSVPTATIPAMTNNSDTPPASTNKANVLWNAITFSNTLVHFDQNFRDTSNTYIPKSTADCGNPNGYNMTLLSVVKSIIYNCSGGGGCISNYKTQYYNPNIGYSGFKGPDHYYTLDVKANYQGYQPIDQEAIDKNYDIEKAMVAALADAVAKIMTTDKQNNYCENNSDSTTDANDSPIDRNRYGYNYRRYEAIPDTIQFSVFNATAGNARIYNMVAKITESNFAPTTSPPEYCMILTNVLSSKHNVSDPFVKSLVGSSTKFRCE